MRGSQLRGLARRMKGVADAQQALDMAVANSASATMEATRPPRDLPPIMSGRDPRRASTAARYSSSSASALGGGLRAPVLRAAM